MKFASEKKYYEPIDEFNTAAIGSFYAFTSNQLQSKEIWQSVEFIEEEEEEKKRKNKRKPFSFDDPPLLTPLLCTYV